MQYVLINIGVFALSIILLYTMLGCWTFTDAKKRSDKPEVWTLIVVLVPNFIGLIIYLLIGRTKTTDEPQPPANRFFIPLIVSGILTILSFVALMTLSIFMPLLIL